MEQKRAVAVHDISCVGRCSLTVALPVLSAAGVNTAIVPTALLSTHTGGFTGYTHLDLSDQLLPIAKHIATLGLHFDAFYSGYLASPQQVDTVLQMLELTCDEKTHIFVDPAFADGGKLYTLMKPEMAAQMKRLCSRAHTIVPNMTEAAMMLGEPYREHCPPAQIETLLRRLSVIGPENVVITGVSFEEGKLGAALYQKSVDRVSYYMLSRFPGVYHGTGDVFASFLLAALMADQSAQAATQLALEYTHRAIALTSEAGEDTRYGVQFERVLRAFIGELA